MGKTFEEEIGEILGDVPVGGDEPSDDTPNAEDAPKADEPDEPEDKPKEDETPPPPPPPEDKETPGESDDNAGDDSDDPESFRASMERMAAETLGKAPQGAKGDESAEAPKEEPKESTPKSQQPPDYVGDLDLDEDILKDKATFNKFLHNFAQKIREETKTEAAQTMLVSLPSMVQRQVNTMVAIQEAVKAFYKENSDLAKYKSVVGMTVNKLQSEHPDWAMDKLMTESAKVARKALRLKASAQTPPKAQDERFAKPAIPSTQRRAGNADAPKSSKMQKQIDEILNIL